MDIREHEKKAREEQRKKALKWVGYAQNEVADAVSAAILGGMPEEEVQELAQISVRLDALRAKWEK